MYYGDLPRTHRNNVSVPSLMSLSVKQRLALNSSK